MPGHKLGSLHWLAVVGDPELHRWGFVAAKQFLERWRTQMQRHSLFKYSLFMSNTWTSHKQPVRFHDLFWPTGLSCHWRMKSLVVYKWMWIKGFYSGFPWYLFDHLMVLIFTCHNILFFDMLFTRGHRRYVGSEAGQRHSQSCECVDKMKICLSGPPSWCFSVLISQ